MAYQISVTINHSYIGSTLTNFPTMVGGTFPTLKTIANGGHVINSSGIDIYFTSDIDALNLLPFERVAYFPATGVVEFWINVPSVSSSVDTTFYMNYGDSSVVSDLSNKHGTWDSNFLAVWHMGDGVTLDLTDSTTNANNGTNTGGAVAATSSLFFSGGAASFGGTSYITIGTPSVLNLPGPLTIECVTSSQPQGSAYLGKGAPSGTGFDFATPGVGDSFQASRWMSIAVANTLADQAIGGPRVGDAYRAVTYDGVNTATNRYYYSGNNILTTPLTASWGAGAIGNHALVNLNLGALSDGSRPLTGGVLDEVRISNVVRSTDWLAASGLQLGVLGSFISPAFLAYGPETVLPLSIGCGSPPHATQGVSYTHTFPAHGGVTPYVFAITAGALPTGITLNTSTGTASGTPTTVGTDSFTIQVTDAEPVSVNASCSITVDAGTPLAISCNSPGSGTVGTPYTHTFTATGGIPPYTFSITIGSLPTGLTLNSSTGVVSGTPTEASTFPFTIEVTDHVGSISYIACTIVILASSGLITAYNLGILTNIFDNNTPRQRKDSFTMRGRAKGTATYNVITDLTGEVAIATFSSPSWVDFTFDISQLLDFNFVGHPTWYQVHITGYTDSYRLADLEIFFDERPVPLTFKRQYNDNFGKSSPQRMRVWPFMIDTRGANVTFTPYVDGVALASVTFNTNEKRTVQYSATTDIFGTDYGYTFAWTTSATSLGIPFELWDDEGPTFVESTPQGFLFWQCGPAYLFRYGRMQRFELRVYPAAGLTSIPYTIYFDDNTRQSGVLSVIPLKQNVIAVDCLKGEGGTVVRIEFGPTTSLFYPYYLRGQFALSGQDTDGQWVQVTES